MKSTEEVLAELSKRIGKTVTISPIYMLNGSPIRNLLIDGQIVKDQKIIDLSYQIANE